MHEIVIPFVIGLAGGLTWLALWTLALRGLGIPFYVKTLEARAARREYIVRIGKLRYIVIFGILGPGLAFGLGMTIAHFGAHDSVGWVGAAIKLVSYAVLFGWLLGSDTWNKSFRGEVPFPPHFPPQT